MEKVLDFIKKVWEWLNSSNRLKHYELGAIIGLGAEDYYSAGYLGVCVGGALEFKDCHHVNGDRPINDWDWSSWDWIDFMFTWAGVVSGYTVRYFITKMIQG